jgi:hypothetical protein
MSGISFFADYLNKLLKNRMTLILCFASSKIVIEMHNSSKVLSNVSNWLFNFRRKTGKLHTDNGSIPYINVSLV